METLDLIHNFSGYDSGTRNRCSDYDGKCAATKRFDAVISSPESSFCDDWNFIPHMSHQRGEQLKIRRIADRLPCSIFGISRQRGANKIKAQLNSGQSFLQCGDVCHEHNVFFASNRINNFDQGFLIGPNSPGRIQRQDVDPGFNNFKRFC